MIALDVNQFYAVVELIKKQEGGPAEIAALLNASSAVIHRDYAVLQAHADSMRQHARQATKHRKGRHDLSYMDDWFEGGDDSGSSVFDTVLSVVGAMKETLDRLEETASGVCPVPLFLSGKRPEEGSFGFEDLQLFRHEVELNSRPIQKFLDSLLAVDEAPAGVISCANRVASSVERFYRMLVNRHSVEGMEIHKDPILTDVAMFVFDNVDAHGEVESGQDPDKVSAYTVAKAKALADAFSSSQLLGSFARKPSSFLDYVRQGLKGMWDISQALKAHHLETIEEFVAVSGVRRPHRLESQAVFDNLMAYMKDLDPSSVTYKEKTGVLTKTERFELNHRNQTIGEVVQLLAGGASPLKIVERVLKRKEHLRKLYLEENSFYSCIIGQGNAFTGEAPGGLKVVPAEKPTAHLDEVIGEGFDEVRTFLEQIQSSARYHDLFLATSPSKTADKANVLLVGPQGCGKTEVLRAVGADSGSIGIFAQGSDFQTCWKGEAEKNPKRLFEAAVKLSRDSGRRVHILIDEIDAVLRSDRHPWDSNLALEFQILMDGVIHYPKISMWGATNNPERIPMPLIRRFSKVLIVGRLDERQRAELLEKFVGGFLPVHRSLKESGTWKACAAKLNGATGDVLRKIADTLWRQKMTEFTSAHPEEADKIVEWLNEGHKFSIGDFSSEKRAELKERLGEHIAVLPEELEGTVDSVLENIAIRQEIDTAVDTYRKAEELLLRLRNKEL